MGWQDLEIKTIENRIWFEELVRQRSKKGQEMLKEYMAKRAELTANIDVFEQMPVDENEDLSEIVL